MPVYVKKNQKILFFHIPKAGGSSFEYMMNKYGWREEFKVSGWSLDDIAFMKVSPQHYHADLVQCIFNLDRFDKIIAIVRNPLDRFKSEYYWQRSQNNFCAEPSEWTYNMFEEYDKNPCAYDNHIRPQSDFIVNGCEVFFLESGGVDHALKFCNEFPDAVGGSVAALFSFFKKRHRLKVSSKLSHIEEEFESLRPLIEGFYSKDVDMYNRAFMG